MRESVRWTWGGHVNESGRDLQDMMREAMAKGGPAAALDVLAGMGVAVEKEPEPGMGMRMRSGAGTEDGFTTTMYAAAAERPAGWPADIPFLADTGGSLTLFDQPGRGFSVQWWKVPDPSVATQLILDQCLAAGWRRPDATAGTPCISLPGMQTVALERDSVTRVLMSLGVKGFGFVQLVESRPGESRATGPTPARP
jgi:hypothetical protein